MDEVVHQSVVARHNDHQIVPVVLHGLQKGVDGLLTEVVLRSAVERISLVDEQHAAQSRVDDPGGLDGRLPHVSGHQTAAVHLHQLPLGENAEAVVDTGHEPGHGGFAGTGVAGKDHVEAEVHGRQTVGLSHLIDRHHIDEVFDLFFNGGEPI